MKLKIFVTLVVVFALGIYVARRVPTTVHVEHTFNAPVAKVWAVWTDPEAMKQWWSPTDYTAPVIRSNLQVGGRFLYAMKSPKGEMSWNAGTYTEIVPLQKIVSTMSFSDENGRAMTGAEIKIPGVWPDSIGVVVEFKDLGAKTLVSVTETGIPAIMKLFASMGWTQQFEKFEKLL
ncbi:MAG: SRPBCC domain-containing protein [Bdellovibrionota bacterium]